LLGRKLEKRRTRKIIKVLYEHQKKMLIINQTNIR